MPLFGKQSKTFIDLNRGDAEVARLRGAAASKDWRTVEAAFQATADQMRREYLIDSIALQATDLGWVEAWIKEKPADALPRVLWGACAIQYAWQIRSGRVPEQVSRQQFQGFHEWLTHAEEQLVTAANMDRADASPYVSLLWTAVGLNPPPEEAQARWHEAVIRNPPTEHGLWAYVTYLSPRWNGSADQMWSFVHDVIDREPEGGPRWAMVPVCHFEQATAESMERNTSVRGTGHFEKPEVQREILDAYTRYLASPAKQQSYLESLYREFFAGAFLLMGAREPLRAELAKMGPGIQTLPWGLMGKSVAVYDQAREWAGLR